MPGEIQRKQTWHGDMVKAQERIHALHRVLGAFDSYNALLARTSVTSQLSILPRSPSRGIDRMLSFPPQVSVLPHSLLSRCYVHSVEIICGEF